MMISILSILPHIAAVEMLYKILGTKFYGSARWHQTWSRAARWLQIKKSGVGLWAIAF
jgi:hypothetical protein